MPKKGRILTDDRVIRILLDCLYNDGEPADDAIKVEGIVTNYGLHPDRLHAHEGEIREMLRELPDEFFEGGGGGWSFLNACMDRKQRQWTGEHRSMERLLILGKALGFVTFVPQRSMWDMMPGSVPYVIISDDIVKGVTK